MRFTLRAAALLRRRAHIALTLGASLAMVSVAHAAVDTTAFRGESNSGYYADAGFDNTFTADDTRFTAASERERRSSSTRRKGFDVETTAIAAYLPATLPRDWMMLLSGIGIIAMQVGRSRRGH